MTAETINLPKRYRYNDVSFSGGQADVYICSDLFLARDVAIKFYRSVDDVKEFLNEIALYKNLRSQHIAGIYDFVHNSAEAPPGIVQEYVSGEGLDSFGTHGFVLDHYLKTLYQIATGISDMHEQGFVHRDIKPHNMRFDSEGVVKILDFGLSCSVFADRETLHSRGTFGFRAPEFFGTSPVRIRKAMDVYAFGATAWFLATNTLPSPLLAIPPLSGSIAPSIGTLKLNIPAEVVVVIDACLERDWSERPSMMDVRDAIRRQLLYGKHKAELVAKTVYSLSEPGKAVRVGSDGLGYITIGYNGFDFVVQSVEPSVYINNVAPAAGEKLRGSCVLTIGPRHAGAERLFVPFNVSHPEVVL